VKLIPYKKWERDFIKREERKKGKASVTIKKKKEKI